MAGATAATAVYGGTGGSGPNGCVVLIEANPRPATALWCPTAGAPSSGFGTHATYHTNFDLVEIAPDVAGVTCGGETMPTFTVAADADRRFAVLDCGSPTALDAQGATIQTSVG